MGKSLISSEIIPAMFDSTRRLKLKNGVHFSEEHVIMGPKTLEDRSAMGYPERHPSVPLQTSESVGPGGFYRVDVTRPTPIIAAPTDGLVSKPGQHAMNADGYRAMQD